VSRDEREGAYESVHTLFLYEKFKRATKAGLSEKTEEKCRQEKT